MADSYFDKANRHEVYVQRLATQLLNENVYPNLASAYKQARSILFEADELKTFAQVNRITKEITKSVNSSTMLMWDDVTGQLVDFAVYEAAFTAKLVGGVAGVALSVPAEKKIASYINSSIMNLTSGQQVNADVWQAFTAKNTNSITSTYSSIIKAGYSNGETNTQIAKRLRDVTNGMLKRNAEALTRTGMSHYAINARDAMAQDNKDVITGKYINTVFDNRRSLICTGWAAKQDARGKPYELNDPSAPVFPAHFSCRTNYLFLTNNQTRPEGTRAAVGGLKSKEAETTYNTRKDRLAARRDNPNIDGKTSSKVRYRGRKDSETFKAGQISGATKNDNWYRDQPTWWQDSALGKKRADLFRAGRIDLEDMTDFYGRPLTIKELIASGV